MKTDKEIQKDVIAELNFDPAVNQAEIGVEVKDGVVTLSGHVSNYPEKWNAETAAQRVAGVQALVIDMDIVQPTLNVRSDADIERSQRCRHCLVSRTYLALENLFAGKRSQDHG